MDNKKNEVSLRETEVRVLTPAEQISSALAKGANLAELRGLLELQKDYEAMEARKAFNLAMANFKANPPKIAKDKKVSYSTSGGQVNYNHASLANVVEKISAELSKYGLSASWKTNQVQNIISVTCKITHAKGHSEETTLSAGADKTGSKNDIQQVGSTITYLERYTLLALTGLATYDQDNDGRGIIAPESIKYITEKQKSEIVDCIAAIKKTEKSFCALMKIESIEKLPAASYPKAMNIIKIEADKMGIKL